MYIFWNLFIIALMLLFIAKIVHIFCNKHTAECPPFLPSFGQEKRFILAEVSKLSEQSAKPLTIIDAGCGIGTLLRPLAKKFKQHCFIGIEWGFFTYIAAKILSLNLKNLSFVRSDFFKIPLNNADIVVCFLMPPLMKKMQDKLLHDCDEHTIIFSNSFKFPNLEQIDECKTKGVFFVRNVYVYKNRLSGQF